MKTINEVLAAMKGVYEAKGYTGYGCCKYWISDLHAGYVALGGDLSLEAFKAMLLKEQGKGYWLSRCDMPPTSKGALHKHDASLIKLDNAMFHFVVV